MLTTSVSPYPLNGYSGSFLQNFDTCLPNHVEDSNMNTNDCEILQSDTASFLPSLPPSPSWYVMCSSLVPAATIVKLEMPEIQPLEYGAAQKVLSCFQSN